MTSEGSVCVYCKGLAVVSILVKRESALELLPGWNTVTVCVNCALEREGSYSL